MLTIYVLLIQRLLADLVVVIVLLVRGRVCAVGPRALGEDDAVAFRVGPASCRDSLPFSAGQLRDAEDGGVGVLEIRPVHRGVGRKAGENWRAKCSRNLEDTYARAR